MGTSVLVKQYRRSCYPWQVKGYLEALVGLSQFWVVRVCPLRREVMYGRVTVVLKDMFTWLKALYINFVLQVFMRKLWSVTFLLLRKSIYRGLGPRVSSGRVTVHLINDGPLNPHFLGKHGPTANTDFSPPRKHFISRFPCLGEKHRGEVIPPWRWHMVIVIPGSGILPAFTESFANITLQDLPHQ